MNVKELIEKIKNLPFSYIFGEPHLKKEYVLEVVRQLDEPEKPIRLKDVIKRIKKLDVGTQKVWLNEILNELGSDYGLLKYKAGYDQGKLEGEWVGNQLKDADKIRRELNKPVVPQFVADWYEENKDSFEANLYLFVCNLTSIFNGAKINEFQRWFLTAGTKPFQTLINMHQFGYTVEKPKRYFVKMKGVYHGDLGYADTFQGYSFYNKERNLSGIKYKLTRKQLEDAGFGEVFNSPLFEVEEVTE